MELAPTAGSLVVFVPCCNDQYIGMLTHTPTIVPMTETTTNTTDKNVDCTLTAVDNGSYDSNSQINMHRDTFNEPTRNDYPTGSTTAVGSTVTKRNSRTAHRSGSFTNAAQENISYHTYHKRQHRLEINCDPTPETNQKLPVIISSSNKIGKTNCASIVCFRKSIKTRTSILLMTALIFATILCTGVVLINFVAKANTTANRVDVQRLAVETGQFFANELDKATLPLFSLAQFATELELFDELAGEIGQAGSPGSLPFLNTTKEDMRVRRNITGVCDQTEVVERFNKIAQAATVNAKLGDVLHNVQFAPFGVICLSSPLVYVDAEDGTTLNNSAVIGVDILNTPQQQYLARESLKGESIGISGPRILVQCPDCGLYFIVRIPIVSMTNYIEIDGQEYNRWGFATALIQWEKLVERSYIFDKFASQNKDFKLTRTDRVFNATTNRYDESIVTLVQSENYQPHGGSQEIEHSLQTTNNEWIITIQYDDNNSWLAWAITICVVVALCISTLTYVILSQKQHHAFMKSQTMIQDAKVNIERNMTAYFAHELRNPLSAIDCALLAMPDNLPTEAKELIFAMKLCSTFMSSIMNNLLDVRKMEEGQLALRYEPFSLSKLVEHIHTMALPTMKPNVQLIHIAETENRDWVLGDVHRLEQIMYNIVSNAIKYTRAGSVTIYAGWDTLNNVRLECRDTGPGIPKEEQASLFERFTQRGGAPGSGLGLAIAKKLVTLMGGSIWFDSDPTQRPGTTCIASLPLQECTAPVEVEDPSKEIVPIEQPISILIVDDITMNRTMLRRRFEKCIAPNCTIHEVTTGEESLSVCDKAEKSFDVIIMDHYMNEAGGVMLGTDAIIALRRMHVGSCIIGCSGNDLDEKFVAAGADWIWKKPLPTNDEIIQQLRSLLATKLVTPLSSAQNCPK